jgi:hypothetical protein
LKLLRYNNGVVEIPQLRKRNISRTLIFLIEKLRKSNTSRQAGGKDNEKEADDL